MYHTVVRLIVEYNDALNTAINWKCNFQPYFYILFVNNDSQKDTVSYYNAPNLRLSVRPTPFNSETVADMEKFQRRPLP